MRARFATTTIAFAFVVLACDKSPAPAPEPPASATATTAASSPSASPSLGAVVDAGVPSTPASAAAAPSAAPSPSPIASAPASAAARPASKGSDAPAPASASAAAVVLKPASKKVSGKNFSLDLATPGCKAGTECTMTIKLVTAGDWHVNKEYPYKFVATAAPNVTFLGKGDATAFTRANGDFVEQGEKSGLMTVRFTPAAAGDTSVAGTYKFSVCSAEQCQIEQEKLDLTVPVM